MRNVKSTVFTLIGVTIASKVLGFMREICLSFYYGASNISDAYILSTNIPVTIFGLFTMGLATSIIPVHNQIFYTEGENKSKIFISTLTNVTLLICTIIICICLIFARTIVDFMASGFTETTLQIATDLTKISIFSIYFIALFTIFKGILQIYGHYVITAIGGIILDTIMIFSIILSTQTDYRVLAIGLITSYIFQLIILYPFVKKCGYSYIWSFDIKNPYIKKMLALAFPVMVGTAVSDINVVIDNALASQVGEGAISTLNYATKINSVAQSIFLVSITSIYFPEISKCVENGDKKRVAYSTCQTINNVLFYIIPIMIGTIYFSKEIVEVLFHRGAFDSIDVLNTAQCLTCYAIGLLGISIREVISKVFYAYHNSKVPMINGILTVILNIVLNFVFMQFWGIQGLALATSISITLSSILLSVLSHKYFKEIWTLTLMLKIGKILIASFITVLIARIAYKYTATICDVMLLKLSITCIFAIVIYHVIAYLFRIGYEKQSI